MIKVRVIHNTEIPEGEQTTKFAMMPKIFQTILPDGGGEVWVGRNRIRKFKKSENAVLKFMKVYLREIRMANKIYKKLTEHGPIIIKKRNNIDMSKQKPSRIGFENVI